MSKEAHTGEHRKVESRMDHWGVPCLSLCEKSVGEGYPSTSSLRSPVGEGQASITGTAESITEWISLRPHVCSETKWERYPDGTSTLVKSLYVFDWREIISTADNFCQPSEHYDEIFSSEVEREMADLQTFKPLNPITMKASSKEEHHAIDSVGADTEEVDDSLDITDPEERAALEKEFEKLEYGRAENSDKDEVGVGSLSNVRHSAEQAIPNKVLLAEILLLRKEMRIMQQTHSQEIVALRGLLEQLVPAAKKSL